MFSALTGCVNYDTWMAQMFLVGTSPMEDPSLCARIVILNESKRGENVTKHHDSSEYKLWKNGADWTNNTATYTIWDLGPLTAIHKEGDLILADVPYQNRLKIELHYGSYPEWLKNPYFEIEVTLADASSEVNSSQSFDLGFQNNRTGRKEMQIDATEGLCGFEYRYRALLDKIHEFDKPQLTEAPSDF